MSDLPTADLPNDAHPSSGRPYVTGHPGKDEGDRDAFNELLAAWRRAVEAAGEGEEDVAIARQLFAAPVPYEHMMLKKLEVIAYYLEAHGTEMGFFGHMALVGVGALRADLARFHG